MPGGIISKWKLTLDPAGSPTVLVDVGDKLEDELSLGLTRLVSVTPLVRAAAPVLRNQKNAQTQISFAIYQDAATDAASRQDMLVGMLTAVSAEPKPLKIEVSGITDRYWQFANAIVTGITPLRYISGKVPRRLTRYDITAVSLSQVGP